jgi:hypothetical protein
MTKTDKPDLKQTAAAARKEALEEHVALMQTALTQARGHSSYAVDKYIRALVSSGAARRLVWAVRAEMTGDVRPPPPTAEEMERRKDEVMRQGRKNAMKNECKALILAKRRVAAGSL